MNKTIHMSMIASAGAAVLLSLSRLPNQAGGGDAGAANAARNASTDGREPA